MQIPHPQRSTYNNVDQGAMGRDIAVRSSSRVHSNANAFTPAGFARFAMALATVLLLADTALPNGQNDCTNWPGQSDPDWVTLTNHIRWCHQALVERYVVAGLNTNLVHKPTYVYPFYDYRGFLSNVEFACSSFVDQDKIGPDGTFDAWFATPTNYYWLEGPGIWDPREAPVDFPYLVFSNLLDYLSPMQLQVRYPDTVNVPSRTVVVPGWQVGELNTKEVRIFCPAETVPTNDTRWYLDELPLRIWQDANQNDAIPKRVAAAIEALSWTSITGYFTNTVTVHPTNTIPNDPVHNEFKEVCTLHDGIWSERSPSSDRSPVTPNWYAITNILGGTPSWRQKWFECHTTGALQVATQQAEYDDYWTAADVYNTTTFAVGFQAPTNYPGQAEAYTLWKTDPILLSDYEIAYGLNFDWLPYGGPIYYEDCVALAAEMAIDLEWGREWWHEEWRPDLYWVSYRLGLDATLASYEEVVPERFKKGLDNILWQLYRTHFPVFSYEVDGPIGYPAGETCPSTSDLPVFSEELDRTMRPNNTLHDVWGDYTIDFAALSEINYAPGFDITSAGLPLLLLKWEFPSGPPPPTPPSFATSRALPDTDRDDLVDIGVDIAALGPDTGLMTYLPEQTDPYLVTPQIQPPAWFAGLDVKGYFTCQTNLLPYWHNIRTSSSWKTPVPQTRRVTDNDGYHNAFSLNTRVLDAGACTNAGIKKAALIRPRGQVVVFNFEETDAEDHTFSSYGCPEAPYDNQSYVLVDTTPNNHYDLAFELRFASGIVHVFGTDGLLTQVKDHQGYSVTLNRRVVGAKSYCDIAEFGSVCWTNGWDCETNVGPISVADLRYGVTNTWEGGRLKSIAYSVPAATVNVSLEYDSGGMIQTIDKDVPEFDPTDATRTWNTIKYGPASAPGVTLTRNSEGASTILIRTVPGEESLSVTYTLDAGRRILKQVVNANGGSAETTFVRESGGRYPSTGILPASRINGISYPDNSTATYTYDPATGWLASETRPIGNGSSRIWEYSYGLTPWGIPGDDAYGNASTNVVERPRKVDLKFDSTVIGHTLHAYIGPSIETKRCRTGLALWNDPDNLHYQTTRSATGPGAGLPGIDLRPAENTSWGYNIGANLTVHTYCPTQGRNTEDTINAFGHTTASKVISTLDGANVTIHHVTRETDAFGRITEETDQLSGDTREFLAYCLHGPQTVVEIDGSSSSYEYTPLGYVKKLSESAFGRTTTWKYDPLGNVKSKVLTADDKTWTEEATYDAQSRLTHQSNPQTYSDYAYSSTSEGTTVVTTRPKLGDIREEYYFDGSLKKRYGDGAVVRTLYKYEIDEGMYRVQRIALNTSDGETQEKSKTFYNLLGAVAKTSDGNDKIYTPQYDSYGRQDNATDPEGYLYPVQYHSTRNEIEKTGVGDVDESGNNPVNKSERSVSASAGQEWKTKGFPNAGSGADVVMSGTRVSLNRKTTTTTRMGLQDTTVQASGYASPGKYTDNTAFHNGRTTASSYNKWRIKREDRKDSAGLLEETVDYNHSGLGALISRTSTRNGAFSYGYDSVHRLKSITPPDGLTGFTTINYFENTTLRNTVMKSDGTTYGCDYTPAGLLKEEFLISGTGSGAGTGGNIHYLYDYDGQGRLTHLRYFNGGSFVTTEWKYYEKTGLLEEKKFQGGSSEQYEYRDNGQLSKITLPDGVTQNFVYDTENALLKQVNTIGGGVNLTTTFDRLGRPQASTVVGGAGQSLSRESDGQPATEAISGSVIAGGTVTRTYFAGHRGVNAVTHAISSGDTSSAVYTYNNGPRVETVTRDDLEVTYDYNVASLTPDFIEWRKGATPVLSCLIDWDAANTRIAKMTYSLDGTTFASYDYAFIAGGHRISRITLKDTSYWQYAYDGRGYLLSANLYDSTGTPVLGRHFFFSTDTMGNLLQSGPMDPSGVPMYSFTANSLNLHVTRVWGSQVEIGGTADPVAVVTVNGVPATRQGSLFRAVLTVDNSGGAVDLPVAVNALNPANQVLAQATGTIRVPKDSEVPAYGVNGQIAGSSKYSCQWNGLGWLTQVDSVGTTPAFKIEFDYYPDGRRARKRYSEQVSGTWTLKREHHFYYDRWLLIAEKVIDNGTTYWNRYTWGLDIAGRLSGRMGQEAGGIGGLLAVQRVEGSTVTTYLPICDHNGNVMAVVDADTKEVVAEYTYSPYGTLIASDGPAKDKFPLRFQSKYYDPETGFYYYGYRLYDPMTAKWLSRDPLGEQGGVNLTAFCSGDPINRYDAYGLADDLGKDDNGVPIRVPTGSTVAGERPNGSILLDSDVARLTKPVFRIVWILEQFGHYRPIYVQEAQDLLNQTGPEEYLERLRGQLKDKWQKKTPPEVAQALETYVGKQKYDSRQATGSFNPSKTNARINAAAKPAKYAGRIIIVVALAYEATQVVTADDWKRQLASSSAGTLGAVAGGSGAAAMTRTIVKNLPMHPYAKLATVLASSLLGASVGGELSSFAAETVYDVYVTEDSSEIQLTEPSSSSPSQSTQTTGTTK